MQINKATVASIRPVSWKICVAGEDGAKFVRHALSESGLECSDLCSEPQLQEPPMYSFIASPLAGTSLTAPELQAILQQNSNIETVFET